MTMAVACGGDKSTNPISPSPSGAVTDDNLGPDNSTLKVNAPSLVSPANGSTLQDPSPTLRANTTTAKFVQGEVFAYRFQLLRDGAQVATVRGSTPVWTVTSSLDANTTYGWRVRAEQGTAFGPWSDTWTFKTPEQTGGYIRGGELYDPLINGKTVGTIVGPVTFIPGKGVKLESLGSYIKYRLGATVTSGEISLLVTNLAYNTEGGKTKIMAMSEGESDITTNDRRFTIEKRGDPPGTVAWRVLTSDDQIDTIGGERRQVQFNTSATYFWQATWGGNRFNLLIQDGGVGGRTIYNFGKRYAGVYDPNPHVAYVGGPGGRAGQNSGSVPDIIVRQVWLSNRPRPPFANK
jgi:hypothetical protein